MYAFGHGGVREGGERNERREKQHTKKKNNPKQHKPKFFFFLCILIEQTDESERVEFTAASLRFVFDPFPTRSE